MFEVNTLSLKVVNMKDYSYNDFRSMIFAHTGKKEEKSERTGKGRNPLEFLGLSAI